MPRKLDSVYLINLDKDTQRLKLVMEECAAVGITPTRIPGINGQDASEYTDYISDFHLKVLSPSVVGCGLSHIKVWQKIVENNESCALVLEDDVKFVENFKEKFAEIFREIPEDFYITYLGCLVGCKLDKKYSWWYSFFRYGFRDYEKQVVK